MNRLALGTAQFGLDYGIANRRGRVELPEVRVILDRARRVGIDTVDTATMYGDSERQLGLAGVAGWRVITKLPSVPESAEASVMDWVISETRASLERLRTPQIDAVLLHRPGQLLSPFGPALYRGLEGVKKQGLVRKIGISVYSPEEIDRVLERYRFDVVQAPLNIVDRRLVTTGWLDRLIASGVEVHARSVFLQGLLLMPARARPVWAERWRSLWNQWDQWLVSHQVAPVDACLAYALSTIASRVIVGIDSAAQMEDLIRAADQPSPIWPPDLTSSDPELVNPSLWPRH